MANVVKTLRDEQNEVARGIAPLLKMRSPYSVYAPYENMEYEIAKPTVLCIAPDIERFSMQGRFAASDMFILKAIDCLGYCSATSARNLLRYFHKCDMADAAANKRPPLNIPNAEDANEFSERLLYLCKKGLVVRHRFLPNTDWSNESAPDENGNNKKGYRYFYHLTGIAAGMYKAKLQDKKIAYNPSIQYLPEVEVFRQVSASILVGALIRCPYLVDAKFQFKKGVQNGYKRDSIPLYAVLKVNPDGIKGPESQTTRLIIESLTLNVNQHIQTAQSRKEWMHTRIKELSAIRREYQKDGMVKILLVAEDLTTLSMIRNEVFSVDATMVGDMMFTTGAVLEKFRVMEHPEALRKSFIEFPIVGAGPDSRPRGAVGYYFLKFGEDFVI